MGDADGVHMKETEINFELVREREKKKDGSAREHSKEREKKRGENERQ